MKRISYVIQLLQVLFFVAFGGAAFANTISFGTDPNWTVSSADGTFLGNAQNVCLNANTPANCPAGATVYGYPYSGWPANLSSIPGAKWIWAPGITGASPSAQGAEYTFQFQFYLCGTPTNGSISVAADNVAEVKLNGAIVGNSSNPFALNTITISADKLSQGLNIIEVKVKNDQNPGDCPSGKYQCNPAALVLGATFSDALSQWPQCTGNGGRTFTLGQNEALACRPGETGAASRTCICIGSNGLWSPVNNSGCALPPVKCSGTGGVMYSANQTETLACPAGQAGTQSHVCQTNGSWGATAGSCTKTCAGNGGIKFLPNETEALNCSAGLVGSQTHRCQADGNWTAIVNGCALPAVGVGEMCGAINHTPPQYATCPSGTECGPKLLPKPPRTAWCAIFGIDCPVQLQTTDWFCN